MRFSTDDLPLPLPLRHTLGFAGFVFRRFNTNNCMQLAGSLTFTTMLAVVPLFTIALTILSTFPLFADLSEQFRGFVLRTLVPDTASKVVGVYMHQFSRNAHKLTAIGVAGLAVTALLLMYTIDQTLNTLWRVKQQRPMFQRVLMYWAVLTLGPVLLAAGLSLSSWLVVTSTQLVGKATLLNQLLAIGSQLGLTVGAFYLLFAAVPYRPVPRRHAWLGAAFTAIGFVALQRLFAAYILAFPTYNLVYGTFASIPIFLLWIYLCWALVLWGATFTSSMSHWAAQAWRRQSNPGRAFYDAVRALQLLHEAFQRGQRLTTHQIRHLLRMGLDDAADLLDALQSLRLIRRMEGQAWMIARPAEQIELHDLFHRLVLHEASGLVSARASDPVERALQELLARAEQPLQLSLLDLLRQVGVDRPAGAAMVETPESADSGNESRNTPQTAAPAANSNHSKPDE